MKLLPYALSLAGLVGALMLTTPAAAQAQGGGISTCGAWRCGFNGVTLNGINLNGIVFNGVTLNGVTLNGWSLNGVTLNGVTLNGWSLNGVTLNGFTVNGVNTSGLGKGAAAIVACADQVAGACKPGVVAITLAGGQRLTVD
jgi:uncharacterized protein YjbI with pentapeptide repeats